MRKWRQVFILILGAFQALNGNAEEKIIKGFIRDVESGKPLPIAHVYLMGTRSGTITNNNGEFTLLIRSFPEKIKISYIGYDSKTITVTEESPDELEINLTPHPVVLETIVVTPQNTAVRIMKEVIRRKQEWHASLQNYTAKAYTRVVLENDKRIASISESLSDISWNREKGFNEKITSKRQTKNTEKKQNFASVRMIPNMYNDDIEILGFRCIGPTHPKALNYYDFKLIGQRTLDGKKVYDISVTPRSKLQPLFVGSISVLDEEYAMIDIDVKPNEAIMFPSPLNNFSYYIKQQFSNYGMLYWFPVDVQVGGEIKLKLPGLVFPTIRYRQLTRLSDYNVNYASADSELVSNRKIAKILVSNKSIKFDIENGDSKSPEDSLNTTDITNAAPHTTDSTSADSDTLVTSEVNIDSLFAYSPEVIPFTEEEQAAYANIDSTMTMERAFRPTGLLARFNKDENTNQNKQGKHEPSQFDKVFSEVIDPFSPSAHYNRVDEVGLGLKCKKQFMGRLEIELSGTYLTGQKNWSHGGKIEYRWGKEKNGTIAVDYLNGTDTRYRSEIYPLFMNSINTLVGNNDYFDYFLNEKFSIETGYRISGIRTRTSLRINLENHSSLEKTTDYNMFNRDRSQRENPQVSEGRLHSAEFTVLYGNENSSFGLAEQKRVKFTIEHSSPSILDSDFSFTNYRFLIDWRFTTFLKRRLIPNALDMHLTAGSFTGDLPVQRFGIIDGTMSYLNPFGVFRTLRNHPLEGEKYCAVFWEHNFRTVPFELIGLEKLARRGMGIIVHGAAGRTWLSKKRLNDINYRPYYYNGIHQEIGISLNALFSYFRLDVTKRLDRHGAAVGFYFARIF